MCVILYKPLGVDLPSKETIRGCFEANPDGSGLAFSEGYTRPIRIEKGFMTFEELTSYLNLFDSPKKYRMLLHFRLATHGSVRPKNTHPYPLSRNKEDLRALSLETKAAVAHNGVISFVKPSNDETDTQRFIRTVLCDINFDIEEQRSLIARATQSRFCIMFPHKTVLIGAFHEFEGCYFSNKSYMSYRSFANEEKCWWFEYAGYSDYYEAFR